jgi:hypothetical protein
VAAASLGMVALVLVLVLPGSPSWNAASFWITGQASPRLLHAQAGSPYLVDSSGRAVYLTGSHTWATIQDRGEASAPSPFDFERFLDLLHR